MAPSQHENAARERLPRTAFVALISNSGGGTRTPDTRIMIPLL